MPNIANFLVENWYLVAMAAVSGGLLLRPSLQRGGSSGVAPAEAVRLINREKGVLIDVRDPAEFATGHAIGARNIPLDKLSGSKDVPSNKALPLLLLCASGARASKAAAQLRQAGHATVHPVTGGLPAWREAGLPVERS